jgi:hypothetical protein
LLRSSSIALLVVTSFVASCYDGVGAGADHGNDGSASSSATAGADDDGGGDDGETEVVAEPLHRLNRLEYDNTVRDLLATTSTPSAAFPPDIVTGGFDNVAVGLVLTPAQMDLYANAARDLSVDALEIRPRYAVEIGARAHAEETGAAGNAFDWGWSMPRGGGGQLAFTLEVPQDETVTIAVLAGGDAVGMPTPEMGLVVDGVEVGHWTVTSLPSAPVEYTVQTALAQGQRAVAITFPNGADQPAENVYNSLVVGHLAVASDTLVTPPGRDLLYVCEPSEALVPAECYHTIVTRFAERAWRRPITADEADEITALWEQLAWKEDADDAVMLVVRAILMSSKFLYRASFPAPDGADDLAGLVPLDDWVLASRLSYFLWSSMPDDALFSAAASGELRDDEGLRAQVRRMLADPKTDGLRLGFAAQWLSTRAFAMHDPDPTLFPTFDEPLRAAMIAEAELFFADFLGNGRPIGEMMTAEFGFSNDRLAQHYGLMTPGSAEMVRVELEAGDRRGLLMHGAWLTATSASNRTSPVNRGRWILDQLLCTPVPPPPPDVPPLEEPEPGETVRETLAKHRENPVCAGCHDLIDPAGLGMEGFDPVGVERDTENGVPIDVSGAIPPGEPFVGAAELATLLADDPRFVSCLTRKLYGYALGRELVTEDAALLSAIEEDLPAAGGTLDALVELVVLSPAFRMRPEAQE